MIRYLASAIFLLAAVHTQAAILTFDNRADFLAAVGATTEIDFGGIAGAGTTASFNTAAGLTLAGVQFVGQTGGAATPNVLTVVDPGFFPAYNRGGLVASLVGPLNPDHGPDPRILINAPVGTPFFAAGFDLYSVQQGDIFPYNQTDTVVIHIDGDSFSVPSVGLNTGNGLVFFGFLSTSPITSFVLETSSVLNANTSIGNFEFSTTGPDVAVPEPSSGIAVLSGIAGLLLLRRRSR